MNLPVIYVAGCFLTAGLLHHNWDYHMRELAKHPFSRMPFADTTIKVAAFLTVFVWPICIWLELRSTVRYWKKNRESK